MSDKLRPDKETQGYIDYIESDNRNDLINYTTSLADLEKQWEKFNSLTYKQRRVSNWSAQKAYGMTNKDYYDLLKSKLLKSNSTNVPIELDDDDIGIEESIITINTSSEVRGLKIFYASDKIEQAKKWQKESLMYIIIPQNSLIELENLWIKWNTMIRKFRRVSDWKAVELFGVDNKTHYECLKSKLLEKDKTDVDIPDSGDDTIIPDTSYTSTHILDYIDSIKFECARENPNTLKIASMCMDLTTVEPKLLSEKVIINKTIDDTIEFLRDNVGRISDYPDAIPNELPYFTPDELIDMGVYQNNTDNLYSDNPDNKFIVDNSLTKSWFEEYQSFMSGYTTEKYHNYIKPWINKLNELYYDFNKIKESGDIDKINSRKQSILELGWNPEINFDTNTRIKVSNKMKSIIENKIKTDIVDISSIVEANNIDDDILESNIDDDKSLYPVFIVLVYTDTVFGKLIVKYNGAIYSHSAIGFEPDLQRLYSYNLSKIYNAGLSFESINGYKKDSDMAKLAVYSVFLKKRDYIKLKSNLDYYIANKDKTGYSLRTIFGILTNNPININLKMICSQFVDSMLKSINVDITNKVSALTIPNDFANIVNPRVYKIYEGDAKSYNLDKVKKTLSKLQRTVKPIKESNMSIVNEETYIENLCQNIGNIDSLLYLNERSDILTGRAKNIYDEFIKPSLSVQSIRETKEFPVQFDNDGNLIIRKYKTLDFESEYAQSHKLLLIYEKNKNLEGIKYELSKLWFMNSILENKIYKSKDSNRDSINKARAKILNDFNKYLALVSEEDKDFNFTSYYNETPFSDVKIKINRSTLKYSTDLIKQILL